MRTICSSIASAPISIDGRLHSRRADPIAGTKRTRDSLRRSDEWISGPRKHNFQQLGGHQTRWGETDDSEWKTMRFVCQPCFPPSVTMDLNRRIYSLSSVIIESARGTRLQTILSCARTTPSNSTIGEKLGKGKVATQFKPTAIHTASSRNCGETSTHRMSGCVSFRISRRSPKTTLACPFTM